MIVGRGMLAKAFSKYNSISNIIVFASGVSNSKETKDNNFDRENNLLNDTISQNKDKLLIYFSTCSIEDKSQQNSPYIIHKKSMEKQIQAKCKKYYIFRLPQVVGKTNSPTLVNFLIDTIDSDSFFYIQKHATRNLIDADDVFIICDNLIDKQKYINKITNVASPFNIKVTEIVYLIEKLLNKKAKFKLTEQGSEQKINIDKIKFISRDIFDEKYLKNILLKRINNSNLGS